MSSPVYTSKHFKFCANARIRVAKVGAAVPTDFKTDYSVDWVELGYIDEKGVIIDDTKTMADIKSQQEFYPTAKMINERKHTLQFNLQEWTKDSVSLAFGGGTWSTVNGVNQYTPPDPSLVDNRQLALDWTVNGVHWRWVVTNGLVTSNTQTTLVKSAEALLPITFEALGSSSMGAAKSADALPWTIFNDDSGFAVAAPHGGLGA